MFKHKITLLIVGLVIILPTLACGSVGVYNPQATQQAMEGTVIALQATIAAMENKTDQAQPDQSDEERIVVVTATPTPTSPKPVGSATVIPASSLGQTIQLTSTPTPTPITITQQDTVITVVATFTPSPTPEQHTDAPIIVDPPPGTVVEEGREILLHWGFNGLLKPEEYFDIKIKPDGQERSAYVGWERGLSHNLVANLAPGRYYWSVQVLQGYYKNNSGEPEDRVFEAFTSPESEPRLIIVAGKSKKRTPTPTRRPDLNNNGNSNNSGESQNTPATPEPPAENTPDAPADPPDNGDNGNTPPDNPQNSSSESSENSTGEDGN